jgi:hypothetical protein
LIEAIVAIVPQKQINQRSPIQFPKTAIAPQKNNQTAIAYPSSQTSDRLSKKLTQQRAPIHPINSDRLSKKSIKQRSPIHSHKQRSPI